MGPLRILLGDLIAAVGGLRHRVGNRLSDLSDLGVHALSRHELRRRRRSIVTEVGEYLVHRIALDGNTTVRVDTPELTRLIDRISAIDAVLGRPDTDTRENGKNISPRG